MNDRFGEELTLAEILSDEEKAHDKFLSSKSGENFGPELTLAQVMDILQQTSLPPRATFWEKNQNLVMEAIHNHEITLEIGEYVFKIEYFARLKSVQRFDFKSPMSYIQYHPNGKGLHDSQSEHRDPSTTGSSGDADV